MCTASYGALNLHIKEQEVQLLIVQQGQKTAEISGSLSSSPHLLLLLACTIVMPTWQRRLKSS